MQLLGTERSPPKKVMVASTRSRPNSRRGQPHGAGGKWLLKGEMLVEEVTRNCSGCTIADYEWERARDRLVPLMREQRKIAGALHRSCSFSTDWK
jgi:hypothetical protein